MYNETFMPQKTTFLGMTSAMVRELIFSELYTISITKI